MAKEDRGKVKMTVVHFETESDNETLQENIRSIAQTLSRALTQPMRIVQAPGQLAAGNGNGSTANIGVSEEDFIDVEENEPSTTSPSKSKAKSTKQRQLRTPQPLDIDLTVGDPAFKVFMEQKKPDGDTKRYLAVAQWLKTNLSINEITMDHAYTCYRAMGWNVPNDASVPFRNAKSNGWMKSGVVKGSYVINHIGEGVVNDMGRNA
jgi:hypothetical protein